MTDSSPKKGRSPSTQKTAKEQKKAQQPVAAKRKSQKNEPTAQEMLLIRVVSAGIGLAVFFIIFGIIYSQVWFPTRAIARVNNEELTRRDYWQAYHQALAAEIVQNLQIVAAFAGNEQIVAQYADRSPGYNQQAESIREEPINEELVEQWQTDQVLLQGAQQLGIQVTDGEVYQRIVEDLAFGFLTPAQTELEPTADLLATPIITATDDVTSTATLTDTTAITDTNAPEVSPTPTATPTVDEATTQVAQIFDKAYQLYTDELEQARQDLRQEFKPRFSRQDFQQAMVDQYRLQVVREKLQEQLVAEESFVLDPTPEQVQARQIFLTVENPITDTRQLTMTEELSATLDAAFAARLPEAESLVNELRDGADFVELVADYSEDLGSREQDGDMGFFDQEGVATNGTATYPPAVVDAAFALDIDEISDPVRSPFGWHILQVTAVQTSTFEEQLQQTRTEALDKWLEEQREVATVKRLPEPKEGETTIPTPEEMPTPLPTYMPGPPTAAPTSELDTPPPGMIPTPNIVVTPVDDTENLEDPGDLEATENPVDDGTPLDSDPDTAPTTATESPTDTTEELSSPDSFSTDADTTEPITP